jgi:hypothetical protein
MTHKTETPAAIKDIPDLGAKNIVVASLLAVIGQLGIIWEFPTAIVLVSWVCGLIVFWWCAILFLGVTGIRRGLFERLYRDVPVIVAGFGLLALSRLIVNRSPQYFISDIFALTLGCIAFVYVYAGRKAMPGNVRVSLPRLGVA